MVGFIAEGDDAQRQLSPNLYTYDMVHLAPHFSVAVTKQCHLVPEPLRNRDLVQIEFAVEVPWVLDETWD